MGHDEQEIRFCTSADGARIAYAAVGAGPPLVKAANWLSHLEFDWGSPVWRHWLREPSRGRTLIRYDERGCGLSERDAEEFTVEAWVRDLEAVVEAAGLERFPLLGISQGASIAITYTTRHPEKVSHLILYGGYARGRLRRDPSERQIAEAEVLLQLVRVGWGQDNPAFRQVFTTLFIPEGTPEQLRWFNELQRVSSTPEGAARILHGFHVIDVCELATRVNVPTLVLHGKGDLCVPFEEGRLLASLVPGARFVPLESNNHVLLESEPAWRHFLNEVRDFIGAGATGGQATPLGTGGAGEGRQAVPPAATSGTRWRRVGELFGHAVELPAQERGAFLEEACAGDAELRREVESLLANDAGPGLATRFEGAVRASALSLHEESGAPRGRFVSHYELSEKLGEGGMGVVYRARDLKLERPVALKFLPDYLGADAELKRRFLQEARAAASLDHPNICTVYEVGEAPDGQLFIAMPCYDGETLKEKIARGALPVGEALDYAEQAADGLAHAHEAGIVHRDIKPANLFVTTQGRVKILDFGIAKVADVNTTRTGLVLGTVAYMSPEQASGEPVDQRTDVWSLGVVLYEMVAGVAPFHGEQTSAVFARILNRQPEPLAACAPGAPEELWRVVSAALRKKRDERYETARELALDLLGLKHRLEFENRVGRGRAPQVTTEKRHAGGDVSDVSSGAAARAEIAPPVSPTTQAGGPHNLPAEPSALIGRDDELAGVLALLRRGDVRLVTLTGAGGTGKTRLALAAALALAADFGDGVFFVALSEVGSPELVASAIAQALGVEEAGGTPLAEALGETLRGRDALLVLDNFEHVGGAAPLVAELLAAAPRAKALATSRSPLRLRLEHEFMVPPLALPSSLSLPPTDSLVRYAAVELFVERARAVKPGFALTDGNAAVVAEICQRLDGLPLAIELAAARVRVLSPQAVLARMENRLKLLIGGARDLPARQQTMRGAVAWSYDLLHEDEREMLDRLSVFAGGFTMEAAEAVCEVAGEPPAEVLDCVTTLLGESLLAQRERADGESRFRVPGVVREYGMERLRARGAADEVERRHALHYLALAEQAEPVLQGAGQAEWLDRLEEEHDNLRAALRWSLARDPEAALRLAGSLRIFWDKRGHLSEGRGWLEAALEKAPRAATTARAKALNGAGGLVWQLGDVEAAHRLYAECREVSSETGDLTLLARAYNGLGIVAMIRGERDAARSLYEECLNVSRELGDDQVTGAALQNLGSVMFEQGDVARARALQEEALDLLRRTGNKFGVITNLVNLGELTYLEGDFASSREYFGEGLALVQEVGNKKQLALALDGCAALAAKRGEWRRAALLAGAADALREASGYKLQPSSRVFRDRYEAELRAALGDEPFAAALAEGRALRRREAVAFALETASA